MERDSLRMNGDSIVTSLSSIESVGAGRIHGLSMTSRKLKMHETLHGWSAKCLGQGMGCEHLLR